LKFRGSIIKRQLILRCVLIVACAALFTWMLNYLFLDKYYTKIKRQQLMDMYDVLNSYDYSNLDGDSFIQFQEELARICSHSNINFIVKDTESGMIISSLNRTDEFNDMLMGVIIASENDLIKIIDSSDNYTIANISEPEYELEYIAMYGKLDEGNFFMLRSDLQNIHDGVNHFVRFLFFAGVGSILIAIILIYFVSDIIMQPVLELTNISKRMKELDFSAKYIRKNKHKNEVDILGENFNQMSEKLEDTIGQLKNANTRLMADVEKKTEIDNMRKDFIANVSHELKTPIALISGYAEGLSEIEPGDEDNRTFYCEVIMDEARKMNRMVKQLMKLNSLEFGGDTPEYVRFNLTDLVRNCESLGEMLDWPEDTKIELELVEDVYVWADEYQIEEVLRNYINNAVNHMAGEKVVRVSMKKIMDDKVRVEVFNSGAHIPADSIDKIWDKFYKVDKARTREYGGSGVGLSIVKAIMEAHNNNYGVENVDGGVIFYFELSEK